MYIELKNLKVGDRFSHDQHEGMIFIILYYGFEGVLIKLEGDTFTDTWPYSEVVKLVSAS